jgi:phosphoglycolate phosphatase-like HAD superfamily hydrolase
MMYWQRTQTGPKTQGQNTYFYKLGVILILPRPLLFDMDGVICDTEKDGHRLAFNQAFNEFDYQVNWGVEEYGELLSISGGKERMKHYLASEGFGREIAAEDIDDTIRALHKRKTEIFIDLIQGGNLALRPGIYRLMKEADDNDFRSVFAPPPTRRLPSPLPAIHLETYALPISWQVTSLTRKNRPRTSICWH